MGVVDNIKAMDKDMTPGRLFRPDLGKWVAVSVIGLAGCFIYGGVVGAACGIAVFIGAARFANIMTKEMI